jgi:hypothetical protein
MELQKTGESTAMKVRNYYTTNRKVAGSRPDEATEHLPFT